MKYFKDMLEAEKYAIVKWHEKELIKLTDEILLDKKELAAAILGGAVYMKIIDTKYQLPDKVIEYIGKAFRERVRSIIGEEEYKKIFTMDFDSAMDYCAANKQKIIEEIERIKREKDKGKKQGEEEGPNE